MTSLKKPMRLQHGVRWVARLLTLAGLWPLLAGGLLHIDLWSAPGLILVTLLGVSLAAAVVAWRSEGIGGALLAMSGLALGLVACMALEQVQLFTLLGVGAPQMIAGALLMACWFTEEEAPVKLSPRDLRRHYPTSLHTLSMSFMRP